MSTASRTLATAARMRILALPLTSASGSSGNYTYYHVQIPPRHPKKEGARPSLLKRVTGKAAELWAGFGKAPEGSWKNRTFKYGEKIMDRIEFEELALKSIDPSRGPKLKRTGNSNLSVVEAKKEHISIPLIHPKFFAYPVSPLQHLQTFLQKRTPEHRRGFYFWMLISPLTAPFMIIPIIPNLPFFFCAWRSYHHYRAYKGSAYLQGLLEEGAIEPEPDIRLDKIYESNPSKPSSPQPTSSSSSSNADAEPEGETSGESKQKKEEVILSKDAISDIVTEFKLSAHTEADLIRAVEQTALRLKKEGS